jgi:hypothetical protein
MNAYLACATIGHSPVHAIIALESLAALAALIFVFWAYARHQAAAHDRTKRPMAHRTLQVGLGAWLAVSAAIPVAVNALSGTGWPTTAVCAPAPILQCIGWISAFLVGIGWLISRDVSAHLHERRAAGQPAFIHATPVARPTTSVPLAHECQPAPYAMRELLQFENSKEAQQAALMWARHGNLHWSANQK